MFSILVFLIVNALGFLSISLLAFVAVSMDLIPDMPPQIEAQFGILFLGGTMWAWLAGALFSSLYFFLKGNLKLFCLSLPVLIPLLYGAGVLYYFN